MSIIFLTIYIVCAYVGPTTIFGGLAQYHLELIFLAFALVTAAPSLPTSFVLKSPLTLLLACFVFVAMFSMAASGWMGGTLFTASKLVPNAIAAPLILIAANSLGRMRTLVLVLACAAIFIVLHGARDYYAIQPYIPYLVKQDLIDKVSPYLIPQELAQGALIFRTRGLDFLNDPNDLAQFLVALLPLLFLNWQRKKFVRNFLLIYIPAIIFIFGMFLTHSRSGMLALIAVILFWSRKKIGNTWAVGLCVCLFLCAMALGWTGGRDVGMAEGQDRFEAWGIGFMLMKAHPFFGVGFNRFTDYNSLTAHNSVIVCFTEIGLPGYFLWIAMLARAFRNAFVVSKAVPQEPPETSGMANPSFQLLQKKRFSDPELIRGGQLVLLSLIGFACTAWFLSRAYTLTLFVLLGFAEVFYQNALDRGLIEKPSNFIQRIPRMAMIGVAPVIAAYIFLRVHNVLRLH